MYFSVNLSNYFNSDSSPMTLQSVGICVSEYRFRQLPLFSSSRRVGVCVAPCGYAPSGYCVAPCKGLAGVNKSSLYEKRFRRRKLPENVHAAKSSPTTITLVQGSRERDPCTRVVMAGDHFPRKNVLLSAPGEIERPGLLRKMTHPSQFPCDVLRTPRSVPDCNTCAALRLLQCR